MSFVCFLWGNRLKVYNICNRVFVYTYRWELWCITCCTLNLAQSCYCSLLQASIGVLYWDSIWVLLGFYWCMYILCPECSEVSESGDSVGGLFEVECYFAFATVKWRFVKFPVACQGVELAHYFLNHALCFSDRTGTRAHIGLWEWVCAGNSSAALIIEYILNPSI